MLPDFFFFFLMAPPLIRGKKKWWQKTSEDSCMILLRLPENYQLHQIKFTVRSSFSVALWGKWLRFYTATYAYRGSMIIMGQLSASLCHTLVQYCIIYKWQTTWRSDFAAKCDIFYVLGWFFFFKQWICWTNNYKYRHANLYPSERPLIFWNNIGRRELI